MKDIVAYSRIRADQVELIYRHVPMGILATLLNGVILTFLHWNVVQPRALFGWYGVLVLVSALRTLTLFGYRRDKNQDDHVQKWAWTAVAGLTASGLCWGASSLFMLSHVSMALRLVVAFVAGGMVAGAAAAFSAVKRVYFGFSIPCLLPAILVFFSLGGPANVGMASMLILYYLLITAIALSNHNVFLGAFSLRREREDLITELETAVQRTESANDRLRRARAELEFRVLERTEALATANDALLREVSTRRKAEDALRESETRYRSMVDTSQEGIFLFNTGHRISYANARFAELLDYQVEELIGADVCEFIDESEHAYHTLDRRKRGTRQKRLQRKNGDHVWVLVAENILPGSNGDGEQHLNMVMDITERKEWEERTEELNYQLRSANQELTEFTHSVSHDLRSPLNTVNAVTEAFQEDYTDRLDEAGRMYLFSIRDTIRRMEELIEDLLNLSRVTRSELIRSRVDFTEMAAQIVREYQKKEPGRKADIRIQRPIYGLADPRLMRIALENLLSNAWKFTRKKPDARIEIGTRETQSGETVYFVADNGAGFDMAHAKRLFSPFVRLHSATSFPGTGVGLATVYRIIRRHGGRIWAESQPEQGTVFYFTVNGQYGLDGALSPEQTEPASF